MNYLFLDEADKMIELGHFKELDKILSFIYQKEVRMKSDFPMIKNAQQTETLEDFYIKGPGGKMVSLNDSSLNILHENEYILQNENDNDFEENGDVETNDEFQEENVDEEENLETEWTEDQENLDEDDFAQEEGEEDNYDENEENYEDEESNLNDQDDAEVPKYRRTIVLSATLASSYDNRKKSKKRKDKGKGKGKKKEKEVTKIKGGETTSFKLETLMKKIQFNGKPKLIDLTQESKIPETLIEYKCLCTDEEKILYIYHFLRENPDKSFIIFANTIPAAKRVFAVLTKLEIPAVCLHSEMQQRQRLKKLEKFSNKQSLVLVCTDVASRGLDIPQVNFVVHYQIPRDCDTYVHRSGRTARIGHEGVAYALVGPSDKPNYNSICKKLRDGEGIQTITLSKNALDKIQEMVEAATELEHGEFLLQKQKKSKEWFAKNAKQAEMMIDEDLEKELEETNEEINKKRKIVTKGQISYNKIKQNTKQQLINPKKSKSVFLDSFQIANMSSMISSYGLQKAGVNDTTKVKGRSSHRKGRRK